jgi:hypothetical protein
MATVHERTKIFISYNHKDARYLDRLHAHLAQYERLGLVEPWDDTKIVPGTIWRQEIKRAIAEAKVAILLVSADFLASKFIVENELPPLLTAAEAGGAIILSIILRPSAFELSNLSQFQAVNAPSKPLSRMSSHEKEETWARVAQMASNAIAAQKQTINDDVKRIKVDASLTSQVGDVHSSVDSQEMLEQYKDFDLHIGQDGYVRAHSEQGERIARISILVTDDMQFTLELIEDDRTREKLLREFGKQLYKLLFPNPIHTHLNQTEAVARSNHQKLRLRLIIEPDQLASLPWEFAYREEGGYFLAVNPSTVLSRYLNLPLPANRVRRRAGPLHLLVIIANPTDQTPLDPEEWEGMIHKALAMPLREQSFTIQTVKHATYEKIRDALLEQQPDIIQFIGHGIYRDGKGYLALVESKTSKSWIVDDARFANIFLGADDHLGLVCLATCESAKSEAHQSFVGIAPQLVQRGVPAVIAMQYSVRIDTAEIFLENFYTSIAACKPVDWAVQQARNAISIKMGLDNREFATPVLYMRAKDGDIF